MRVVCSQVPEGDCTYQFNAVGVYYFSSGVVSTGGPEVSFGVTVNVHKLSTEDLDLNVQVNGEYEIKSQWRRVKFAE